ncbi:LCP family protein [Cellulomonas soli]
MPGSTWPPPPRAPRLTVEQLTGIRIDGFIVVDFIGFQNVVDAIGGVPLCTREDLQDPDSGLNLPAGQHVLDGPTALALARARHNLSDGSDTHRLDRQQALVAATVRTVLDSNLLTDAPSLLRTVDAATSAVTVSGGFSIPGLAFSLKGVDPASVVFQTVPSGPMPSNKNRVEWTDEADELWARLRADNAPAPAATPEAPDAGAPAAGGTPGAPATPGAPTADAPPAAPPIDPLADRTPGETISSADAQVTCG